ncbi:coiled-coil domain-containing protein 177 [Hypomesus transpacificus]|uniref:coiled-coil domain-containing protein 177 n=1 Tax=Hypomesus transpacificus TaxID=137520 RepID=UPI001F075588|nr:coiled-coil domain-containing protein 177 [Hypomesus transpacificus]
MEVRSPSPMLILDLNNFDKTEADGSRYVLTSPRSLESCARLGVKPVELLIQSLNEFIEEHQDIPFETVSILYEAYEKKHRKLLRLCREERERMMKLAEDRSGKKLSALQTVLELDSESSDANSRKDCGGEDDKKPGTDPCVDEGFRKKSVSRCRSFITPDTRQPIRLRTDDHNNTVSISLGDFRHSPATERQLERLTQDIKKEMQVTVPEKDRKIAALMLVKHQDEQARRKLSHQDEREREEARRKEELHRARVERRRRQELERSTQRWRDAQEARRRLRESRVEELASQREQELLLQEDRWRRLTEEQEAQQRERTEAARRSAAGRKHYQEHLLQGKEREEQLLREGEWQLAREKEQRATRNKLCRETRERNKRQRENRCSLSHHLLLKKKAEEDAEAEGARMRSALEQKLRRSGEKHSRATEARLQELRERAAREERQAQRSQRRAQQQSQQQLTHKQVLARLSQQRMEQATRHAHAQRCHRAQQAGQANQERQRSHRRLQDGVRREEEAEMARRQAHVAMKEHRREQLQERRERRQEEARKVVRASFHMRERVREQTHRRTFDQMALQAQLTASLGRIKL